MPDYVQLPGSCTRSFRKTILKFANSQNFHYLCSVLILTEMIVTFEYEYLKVLYEEGRNPDKKHRYQPDIIRRYQKAINFLKAASGIEALWPIRSLQYEVLSGDKAGLSSVRVNDQYRVEFSVTLNEKEPILTICNVVELSNHYK